MKRSDILNGASITGGGIMLLVNLLTEGVVPGGFVGGAIGGVIGYFIASVFVPKEKQINADGTTLEEKGEPVDKILSDSLMFSDFSGEKGVCNEKKGPKQKKPDIKLDFIEEWYLKEDQPKKLRQIVWDVAAKNWQPSRFATLMLPSKYAALITNDWITGLFRMASDSGPFLLLRTDGFVPQTKERNLRIGFSFFKMKQGGLFVIYVEPSPRIPRSQYPFIEIVYGLDVEDNCQRIHDFFRKDTVEIVLADRSNTQYTFLDSEAVHYAPQARFYLQIQLPLALKEALMKEWKGLLTFHNSIAVYSKNHNAAAQEMWNLWIKALY